MNMSNLITLKEYASLHNLNPQAVRRRILRGRMEAVKLGRDWFLDPAAEFTDRRRNPDKIKIEIIHEEI